MHSYSVILKALRAEGLKVIEVPGARNRCRCHNGGHRLGGPFARSWAPTGDTMVHITAGDRGSRTALQYIADIINGDPGVPYKANFVPDYDGTVYFNSAGRCNHAGRIGSGALGRIRSQSLPLSGWIGSLRGHDVDGNTWVYGIENIAAHTMTPQQREASVRISAAMARLDRRTGQGTPGHGEASDQRGFADPNLDMGRFRADVMARLRTNPSKPTEQKEDLEMSTRTQLTRNKDIPLKKGRTVVPLKDDYKPTTASSFLTPGRGDLEFDVEFGISLAGLIPGLEVQVRVVQTDSNGKVLHRHPTQEIVGTRGGAYAIVRTQGGCKNKRRLRLEVETFDEGITVTKIATTVRHWR